MKEIIKISSLIWINVCLLSSCSFAQKKSENVQQSDTGTKTLIVYLSRTNNTKAIAEIIQKNVGGDLVAIELEKPYPDNYKAAVAQVEKENETGFLPTLKTKIANIDKYDVVFVGFPTWGMQLPPPMKSFLKQYDLNGKTVIPFNTNAGYGIGSSFKTVQELCKNSTVLEGFEIKGGVERDGILFVMKDEKEAEAATKVQAWLQKIKMKKNNAMKKVIVIGASGSLAKFVIDTLQKVPDVHLTLLARNRNKIANDTTNCTVVEADVMDYEKLKNAIAGQDIVYINLAGDLEAMTKNIVKAMQETGVKRVIAISSIGIYATPLKPVLVPYRKLADIIEESGLDYTILRPEWFTYTDEVDYVLTHKGEPEKGSAISRKSIAAFIATLVENPDLHKRANLGISKP